MPALKDLLDNRQKLIEADRALLAPEATHGKTAAECCVESDKLNADIAALDKQIEELRDVNTRRDRADKHKAMQDDPPRRQTDRLDPKAAKTLERLKVKIGRHEQEVAGDHQYALRSSSEYTEAFDRYLAFGETDKLGLQVSKDNKGGYLAPMAMASQLIKFVDDNVFMRQIATVLPPLMNAVSLGAVSYDSDTGDADWTAEVPASDISEDDAMTFGKRELMPHLNTKLVKVSQKFLETANGLPGGAASFVGSRLGYKFGITEEQAYLTGSGVQQPLGVFVASDAGVSTARDYTCVSSTVFTADEVIDSLGALKTQYQDRAWGLFSRTFVRRARLLKDGTGQYLWGAGLVSGQPDRICNRPYIQSEYVPATYTAGLYIGMWADFSHYWIADSMGLTIQRLDELFQLKNQIGFIARKETDGMPTLAEAFSRIKLKP